MDQRIVGLYDDFIHSRLGRRLLRERLANLTGSTRAALAILPQLQSNYVVAQTVAETDPRLTTEDATFPGSQGSVARRGARRSASSWAVSPFAGASGLAPLWNWGAPLSSRRTR